MTVVGIGGSSTGRQLREQSVAAWLLYFPVIWINELKNDGHVAEIAVVLITDVVDVCGSGCAVGLLSTSGPH